MATSGTINGTPSNSHYSLTCEWSATQNTDANTSTITAIVYLNGNGYTMTSSMWNCIINGSTVTSSKSITINGKTELGRRTWTVNHNSNGTCSTTISFSYSNGLSSSGTYTTHQGSGSGSITLNTIARGSSFTLNRSSVTLGSDSLTLSITRNNSTYKHKIKVIIGSSTYLVGENIDTSFTFTPSINYCNNITSSTSATATIKVETLNSSGTWLAETTKTVTFKVPSSVVPSVSISVTANNTAGGVNVENKTTFTVKPTNAKGSYGSTIKSYSITGGGLNSSSSSGATSGKLTSGNYTFTVKVTDSRGRTASASKSVTVYSYSSPTISARAYRCNTNGVESINGTKVGIKFSWQITNLANNNQNAKKYSVQYKLLTATNYTDIVSDTTLDAYSGSIAITLPDTFSSTSSYNIKLFVKDSYNSTYSVLNVTTVSSLLNIEKEGVGIGKIREKGTLDLAGDVYIRGKYRILSVGASGNVDLGSIEYQTAICSIDDPLYYKSENQTYKIYHEGNKPSSSTTPLASGGWLMNSSQTVTLSKKISDCQHGICLEWRDYNAGTNTANAKDIVYTFIPKAHASRNNGKPLSILLPVYETGTTVITKNLYVYDDKITGVDSNMNATNSSMVVLSAVYEV